VPPVSGQPVRVAFQDGDRQAADPSLRVAARLTADGYEVAALLPLAFLRIGARADALLAEVAVTAHRAGGARLRGTLFGAPRPYCSPAGYGTVQVEDR